MRILVTNDDGIYAPGIHILCRGVAKLGTVTAVAPLTEQSGAGHSITLYHPLRVKEIAREGEPVYFGVGGTPADCVKIAITELLPKTPELVLSGINPGGNIGTNVIYSGTVSAAMEAFVMGCPSIAVSIDTFKPTPAQYEKAADVALSVAKLVTKKGFPKCLLNINLPDLPPKKMKGLKVTRQGMSRFIEFFERRQDPRGHKYYWLDGELVDNAPESDSDYNAVRAGYISITPLGFDMTYSAVLGGVRDGLADLL